METSSTTTPTKRKDATQSRSNETNPQSDKSKKKSRHSGLLSAFSIDITKFSDDGTTTFLWRSHTFTVLLILLSILVYVAIFDPTHGDIEYNTKRGIVACMLVFILLGVTVTPDGVFKRPHPTVWRCTFCCSIIYELGLIFILFQTKPDAIRLLKHIDPKLGVPLEEKDYGGNCLIYDAAVPENPFHNVWDKIDLFVPMHFLGWWLKTLVLRDWWLCTVLSVMFEILEYTLEHQLPNFSECWWDHWIMDALICNGLGIYLGIVTLKYYSMKTYHWRGLWKIPTYKGKLQRLAAQFGPYTWIDYDWKSTSSLGRWLATLGIIFLFLMTELNTFYLKFVMWVPPSHYINAVRLVFVLFWGAVGVREGFQYLDDPDCTKFGRQAWMLIAIISTEFLIVAKFDWETITKPIPKHILLFWTIGVTLLIVWTVWRFFVATSTEKPKPMWDVDQRRLRWDLVRSCELGSSFSTVKQGLE